MADSWRIHVNNLIFVYDTRGGVVNADGEEKVLPPFRAASPTVSVNCMCRWTLRPSERRCVFTVLVKPLLSFQTRTPERL